MADAQTNGSLKNCFSDVLRLKDTNVWKGSQTTVFPREIPTGGQGYPFTHPGDDRGRSAGGLEYVFGPAYKHKWVIAWSNSKNEIEKEKNRVITQILFQDEDVDWDEIRRLLDKSGENQALTKAPFKATIEVTPTTSSTPLVTATFGNAAE